MSRYKLYTNTFLFYYEYIIKEPFMIKHFKYSHQNTFKLLVKITLLVVLVIVIVHYIENYFIKIFKSLHQTL